LEFAVPHSRKPHGLTLRLYRLPIALYRLGLRGLLGARFLLLEHRGRRSGRTRYAVLEVVRRDDATGACIVGSGFGEGSEWFLNLMADPRCHFQVGRRRFAATARRLAQEETERELLDFGGATRAGAGRRPRHRSRPQSLHGCGNRCVRARGPAPGPRAELDENRPEGTRTESLLVRSRAG